MTSTPPRLPLFALSLALVVTTAAPAAAQTPPSFYPADSDFVPATCRNPTDAPADDPCTDESRDFRNVIGSGGDAAFLVANDGTYVFLRLRLESDPRQNGALVSFAWGFSLDADGDGEPEAYVSVIGQGNSDRLEILDQDPDNGTTPDYTDPGGGGTDTSLTPIVTDGSTDTWVDVRSAGANYCADSAGTDDWFLTAAVPLGVLRDFGALGAVSVAAGSSASFSSIQDDYVCFDGDPPSCTTASECASGVCLVGPGVCAPPVLPIELGCLDEDVAPVDGVDDGCEPGRPECVLLGGAASCVECDVDGDCDDGNECTSDTCVSSACVFTSDAAGTACAGGVCDGAATAPACVACVDDTSGAGTDTGCTASRPFCDSTGAPTCVECVADGDCDDANECTLDACASGTCAPEPAPPGTACSGGRCDGDPSVPSCVPFGEDAGPGPVDAGPVDAGTDAGAGEMDAGGGGPDAGPGAADAGSTGSDAGASGPDAGGGLDAASPGPDAGPSPSDAGSIATDGGSADADAGGLSDAGATPRLDAAPLERDADPALDDGDRPGLDAGLDVGPEDAGCSCRAAGARPPSSAPWAAALLVGLLWRRRARAGRRLRD